MPETFLIRSSFHDITAAIPRALEAGVGSTGSTWILCWNRGDEVLPEREVQNGVEIHRFTLSKGAGSPILSRVRFALWVFRHLIRERPQRVQVFDLESAVPSALASLLFRMLLIYDMRDPFAESFRFPWFFKQLTYAVDWLAMSRSNAFVVPSEERLPYLGRWGQLHPACVVRNTCHDEVDSVLNVDLPARPGLDTVRIASLGYLVSTRGADWLIEFTDGSPGDVQLLVAGNCRSTDLLKKLRASAESHFFGRQARPLALGIMRSADVVSLLYDPSIPVNRIAAPNKYYEALMLGKPVLVSRGMSLAQEVEREGLGFVIDYGDSKGLRRAVETLKRADRRQELSERCRRYFLSNCRLADDLERYREFYESLFLATPLQAINGGN